MENVLRPQLASPSAKERVALPEGVAWANGKFCPLREASIPILDWGFLRGDVTYDVVHVWRGRFFRLEDHLQRFSSGMADLRMDPGLSQDVIRDILFECVKRSGFKDSYVEMICTRGEPPQGVRDPRQCINRFYAFAAPFIWIANEEQRERGMRMRTSHVQRIPPESVDPRIKNFNWLDFIRGLLQEYDRGAETVVLLDRDGNITEGPGFNIFIVKGGRVATPDKGVLEGITRKTVSQICAGLQIQCSARPISVQDLASADEIFMTSTAGGVMPVQSINGKEINPGELTARIREEYWRLHEDNVHSTAVDYEREYFA